MSSISGGSGGGGGGMGTVTSISQGNGITLTPNPITTTGTVAISGIVPTTFDSDSGAATTSTNTINIVGGSGITTSGSGDTITISASGGGGGITTINGDSGSITGSTVTIYANTASNNSGASVSFDNTGTISTLSLTDSFSNTYLGSGCGSPGGSGFNITGLGKNTLANAASGSNTVAIGSGALQFATSSVQNTAIGRQALTNLVNGSQNIAIGYQAGNGYTGSESDNIIIGTSVPGIAGETLTLRIGAPAGSGGLMQAFIQGINGVTVTGAAVLVSTSDQLGVAVSSRRFKDNIVDMPSITDDLMKLRPVNFNYNIGNDTSLQSGLIAEEVHEAIPSLVVYDKEGLPQTVKYHDLPVLLLKEIQELRREINELKGR